MKLKQRIEDFRVRELLRDDVLQERGEYRVYRVTKRKMTSFEATRVLGDELGVSPGEIGMAGLKDRQGITVQYMSVHQGRVCNHRDPQIRIETVGFSADHLSSGVSEGNGFELCLRELDRGELEELRKNVPLVRESGLVNYFDEQRFGNLRHDQGWIFLDLLRGQHEQALRTLLCGRSPHDGDRSRALKFQLGEAWRDWDRARDVAGRFGEYHSIFEHLQKKPDDFAGAFYHVATRIRLIHLYAYQSHLWNRAVVRAVREVTPLEDRVLIDTWEGPLLFTGAREALVEAVGENFRLPGPRLEDVENDRQRELLTAVLAEDGIAPEDFDVQGVPGFQLKGEDRPLVVVPRHLRVRPAEPDRLNRGHKMVKLRFELPRGSYASLVARRMVSTVVGPRAERAAERADSSRALREGVSDHREAHREILGGADAPPTRWEERRDDGGGRDRGHFQRGDRGYTGASRGGGPRDGGGYRGERNSDRGGSRGAYGQGQDRSRGEGYRGRDQGGEGHRGRGQRDHGYPDRGSQGHGYRGRDERGPGDWKRGDRDRGFQGEGRRESGRRDDRQGGRPYGGGPRRDDRGWGGEGRGRGERGPHPSGGGGGRGGGYGDRREERPGGGGGGWSSRGDSERGHGQHRQDRGRGQGSWDRPRQERAGGYGSGPWSSSDSRDARPGDRGPRGRGQDDRGGWGGRDDRGRGHGAGSDRDRGSDQGRGFDRDRGGNRDWSGHRDRSGQRDRGGDGARRGDWERGGPRGGGGAWNDRDRSGRDDRGHPGGGSSWGERGHHRSADREGGQGWGGPQREGRGGGHYGDGGRGGEARGGRGGSFGSRGPGRSGGPQGSSGGSWGSGRADGNRGWGRSEGQGRDGDRFQGPRPGGDRGPRGGDRERSPRGSGPHGVDGGAPGARWAEGEAPPARPSEGPVTGPSSTDKPPMNPPASPSGGDSKPKKPDSKGSEAPPESSEG